MTEIKRVVIWGAGAMGALYAQKLYEYDQDCIYLLANGGRYENLVNNGLTVNGTTFYPKVVRPGEKTRPFDLVIVALKHHHLIKSVSELKRAVADETIIMSVMNGIDSEHILGDAYGHEKVLPTVAVGMDALREKGRVTYANEGRLIFGNSENSQADERIEKVKRLFEAAKIAHEVSVDMIRPMWWKLMVNVGVNQTSAVLRAPFGIFQHSKSARSLMQMAMTEVVAIAKALKINLDEKDLEEWSRILKKLSPDGKTSMLQDVEAGRKTEVEIFAGKIKELGEKLGQPTPVNDTLFAIIKAYEEMLRL